MPEKEKPTKPITTQKKESTDKAIKGIEKARDADFSEADKTKGNPPTEQRRKP